MYTDPHSSREAAAPDYLLMSVCLKTASPFPREIFHRDMQPSIIGRVYFNVKSSTPRTAKAPSNGLAMAYLLCHRSHESTESLQSHRCVHHAPRCFSHLIAQSNSRTRVAWNFPTSQSRKHRPKPNEKQNVNRKKYGMVGYSDDVTTNQLPEETHKHSSQIRAHLS
jgi:hypothetical protein